MKFSALGDQAIIVTFGEEIGMDVYEKYNDYFKRCSNIRLQE